MNEEKSDLDASSAKVQGLTIKNLAAHSAAPSQPVKASTWNLSWAKKILKLYKAMTYFEK